MSRLEHEPVLAVTRAGGPWLYGENGERWFDGISSWWTCLLGHRHPEVVAALKDQLDRLDHVMLAGFTHAPAVELGERLAALTGGALGHASFASDGASALEIALKQSAHAWRNRGLPGKYRFVCLEGSYHGETLGALGVTQQPLFSESYRLLLREALVVSGPDDRRAACEGHTAEQEALRAAARLEATLSLHAHELAAVVVEPLMQGAGGMVMYHPEFLRRVRELCDRYQVHWIADEIATGCGRTGSFFAVEHAGVWPDLLCLSKGITGGMLPLSVVLASDSVFESFLDPDLGIGRAFLHSHSFTGNPLACRAAVATLKVLERDQVLLANRARAQRIALGLAPLRSLAGISDFRQLGMIWAFEMAAGAQAARAVQAAARRRGLMIRPLGNTVYLMPPFLLDDDLCDWLGQTLCAAVEEALALGAAGQGAGFDVGALRASAVGGTGIAGAVGEERLA
ncbi:MAG: adenosylmethionine--8-amino-7-oxononanoate transaminase [Pseudomonadota bacterium]|nr:adenosylmethionine--8-amino-7-oxononanoate transaminase [Pseudomonadota bacterium]